MKILHTHASFVVVHKPAGVLSQADEKKQDNMVTLLQEALGGEIFPVHRLDRETAGVMVYARTSRAAAALSRAIQENRFQKEYLAVLTAKPQKEDVLEDLLFYDRSRGKVFPVKRERKGVKKARLSYKAVEEKDGLFLVRVFPETGRTHQIRVQFASRRMPLFGDRKYGGAGEGLGLFCRTLSFPHPQSGEMLTFTSSPQEEAPWNCFSPL